jgi:hypothetical protein
MHVVNYKSKPGNFSNNEKNLKNLVGAKNKLYIQYLIFYYSAPF